MGVMFSPAFLDAFLLAPEDPFLPHQGWPQDAALVAGQSVLYLLRRELKDTGFGAGESVSEASLRDQVVQYRLFATSMLLFAGIDLLTKFALGDKGDLDKRYKKFCRNYMLLSGDHAKRVWKVRNAMMHSFGLYTADQRQIVFTQDLLSDVVETVAANAYRLSVSALYRCFLEAIPRYREAVLADNFLQERFLEIANNYGFVFVVSVKGEARQPARPA